MRRPRSPQKLTTWLCLVAYLFTGTIVAAREMVLCVGPSWHVAFELARDTPCSGCDSDAAAEKTRTAGTSVSSAADAHCPCVDIPIVSGGDGLQIKLSRDDTAAKVHASIAMAPPVMAVFTPTLVFAKQVVDGAPPRPARSHLRTVVLLV